MNETRKEYMIKYRATHKNEMRESSRRYYQKNKEKKRAKDKRYQEKHKDKLRVYREEYRKTHREIFNKSNSKYLRNIRVQTLKLLGNKCIRCGFSDWRALQVDHINGGGGKELRKMGSIGIYRKILELSEEERGKKYQLLCANCNWIKSYENGERSEAYRRNDSQRTIILV